METFGILENWLLAPQSRMPGKLRSSVLSVVNLKVFSITCNTTYKNIQYTTLLKLLAILTTLTVYYVFVFLLHTRNEKKGRTTYYICTLGP